MHTLTRTAAAAAALTALVALTGCETTPTDWDNRGDRDKPAKVDRPDRDRDAAPADTDVELTGDDMDALYLTVVRDTIPAAYAALPDDQLIVMAHTICDGFDAGMTFTDVGMLGLESGMPAKAVGGIVGAGTVAYCPEHEDQIP